MVELAVTAIIWGLAALLWVGVIAFIVMVFSR